ncbi:MAG: zf-HC2 domain-containing protein [Nitriliruptorales bacterium]
MTSDCPEALERLQEYLDGEMEEWQIAEISAHLAACYPCGDRAEFERHLRTVVRTCGAELAPEGLLEKVRACCRNEAPRH